jgi:hypothetical protein
MKFFDRRREKRNMKEKEHWLFLLDKLVRILPLHDYDIDKYVREMETISSTSIEMRKHATNSLLLVHWLEHEIKKDPNLINEIRKYIEQEKELYELEKILLPRLNSLYEF